MDGVRDNLVPVGASCVLVILGQLSDEIAWHKSVLEDPVQLPLLRPRDAVIDAGNRESDREIRQYPEVGDFAGGIGQEISPALVCLLESDRFVPKESLYVLVPLARES
jgi:hypothetical protein